MKGFPMNKRRIATMLMIAALVFVALKAYEGVARPKSGGLFPRPTSTPVPLPGDSQGEAYAAAQATLLAGQSEISGLSQQATVISLNIDQAANVAAQATMDYNQRQLMELSIRATEVSQNVARADATQQFIIEQTQMVENAAATAQSEASTAAHSAYVLSVTQTAQAQSVLDVQANQTALTNATRAAYSLTATPLAAIQADMARIRDETEGRAWREEFVTISLKVVLLALTLILLVVGGVLAYQRLMPVLELRLRTISRHNDRPLLLVDGMMVDPDPPPHRLRLRQLRLRKHLRLPSDETPHVEIVHPSEPSVTNWIAEAEQKLRTDERIYPNRAR